MANLTANQINEWAKQIARKCDGGENRYFFHTFEGFEAEIRYTCSTGEDRGDRWTAPSWWISSEQTEVLALYNINDGEDYPEILQQLNKQLN